MKDLIPWRRKAEGLTASRQKANTAERMERRMNDMFDDFFKGFDDMFAGRPMTMFDERWPSETPTLEVSETEDELRIKAELPGVDEKDIEVSLEGDELTIRGEKRREHEEKHRDYFVSEVGYGEFCRSIELPSGIDRDKVKALFKQGVLTLTLPRTEEAKTQRKRIEVKAA